MLERDRLSFVEMTNDELRTRPEIDQMRAALIDVFDEEDAAMRTLEARNDTCHLVSRMRRGERARSPAW